MQDLTSVAQVALPPRAGCIARLPNVSRPGGFRTLQANECSATAQLSKAGSTCRPKSLEVLNLERFLVDMSLCKALLIWTVCMKLKSCVVNGSSAQKHADTAQYAFNLMASLLAF